MSLSYRHLYTFDIFANPFLWASTLPCFHTFSTGSRTAQCFGGNGSCLSSFICKISTSDTFVLQEGELQRTLEEMGLVWTVFSAAYSASGLTIFTSTNSFITMRCASHNRRCYVSCLNHSLQSNIIYNRILVKLYSKITL